jgi:hypothetical protein
MMLSADAREVARFWRNGTGRIPPTATRSELLVWHDTCE